jgi:V-type H+-transporting ATPase subunit C
MATYWIAAVAAPEGGSGTVFDAAKKSLAPHCNEVCQVDCPADLTFRSFDSLIKLVDDLTKFDGQVEGTLRRFEKTMHEFGPNPEFSIVSQRQTFPLKTYMSNFQWDDAKFPKSRTITENLQLMTSTVQKLDDEVRNKLNGLQELKTAHAGISKKDISFQTRDLVDVLLPSKVNAEDFVDTENMCTVIVVVPQGTEKDFMASYSTMAEFIVPDSAKKLPFEDKEHNSLYRVVLFRKAVDAFKAAARAKRFTVRDFTFSLAKFQEQEARRNELEAELTSAMSMSKMICRAAFSDTFVAWMHAKMMRTFVEAVLRFGVNTGGNPQFTALMLLPKSVKTEKAVREVLTSVAEKHGPKEKVEDKMAEEEFFPYVFLTMTPLIAQD